MSIICPEPDFGDFKEWSDRMAPIIGIYGTPYYAEENDEWIVWGEYVVNLPGIAILSPPNPAGFYDWREWAQRLIEVLQ